VRFAWIPFVVLVSVLACGPSVTQVCDDYALAYCTVRLKCYTGATLTAFQQQYGSTPAACATSFEGTAQFNCTAAVPLCPAGTSYDTGVGETCVSETNNQACPDVINGATPPQCAQTQICH
jgi:hypothetical protein